MIAPQPNPLHDSVRDNDATIPYNLYLSLEWNLCGTTHRWVTESITFISPATIAQYIGMALERGAYENARTHTASRMVWRVRNIKTGEIYYEA